MDVLGLGLENQPLRRCDAPDRACDFIGSNGFGLTSLPLNENGAWWLTFDPVEYRSLFEAEYVTETTGVAPTESDAGCSDSKRFCDPAETVSIRVIDGNTFAMEERLPTGDWSWIGRSERNDINVVFPDEELEVAGVPAAIARALCATYAADNSGVFCLNPPVNDSGDAGQVSGFRVVVRDADGFLSFVIESGETGEWVPVDFLDVNNDWVGDRLVALGVDRTSALTMCQGAFAEIGVTDPGCFSE